MKGLEMPPSKKFSQVPLGPCSGLSQICPSFPEALLDPPAQAQSPITSSLLHHCNRH